jgi:hypothetical protein
MKEDSNDKFENPGDGRNRKDRHGNPQPGAELESTPCQDAHVDVLQSGTNGRHAAVHQSDTAEDH